MEMKAVICGDGGGVNIAIVGPERSTQTDIK